MAQKRGADDIDTALLPSRWERSPDAALAYFAAGRGGEGTAHIYAAPEVGARILDALAALPALRDERDRLRKELEETREERDAARQERAAAPAAADAPRQRHPAQEAEAELGAMISAPFRVSASAAAAARTEPLAALSVQVARALAAEAKEIERARLIAMAFAATRGDLDAFWAARKQRTTAPRAVRKPKQKTG